MTCDRLEPDFPCSGLRSFWLSCAAFAAVVAEVDAAVRFLTDFDIEISIRQAAALPPHHRSPTSAREPAGRDHSALQAPGIDRSTARIAADCHSFLQGTLQVNAGVWSHSA